MSKFLQLVTLLTLSLLSTQPTMADNKEGNTMSIEEKNVLNVIDKMTTAFNNNDIEGIMASYEKNATIVFEPGKPVTDPAVQREMFLGAFAIKPKYSFKGHEVFITNDTAVHITPWTMTGITPDGVDIKQSGLSVAVLRRQEDGQWLMVIDDPHGQKLMNQ